jgi:hypothetical protein
MNEYELKELMFSGKLAWFFLSGGYGIINALELARKYQATFNRTIAYQKGIPFTANFWEGILSEAVDSTVSKLGPEQVYVFGSQDYTSFIKESNMWRSDSNLRLFESTGSSGPFWLAPIIAELLRTICKGQLIDFNRKYTRFTKQ